MPSDLLTTADARADAGHLKTCGVIQASGDCRVTYAITNPVDCLVAAERALDYLNQAYPTNCKIPLVIERVAEEGALVPAGKPLLYVTGSLVVLTRLQTAFVQQLGFACVAARNAFAMCRALPRTSFVAIDAPFCTGDDMQVLAGYGASVGSRTARMMGAKGFLGSSAGVAAPMFGGTDGAWTMSHELIGYAKARVLSRGGDPDLEGTAVEAAKLYAATYPEEETLTVLIDHDGREITDTLAVARWLRKSGGEQAGKTLAVRLDTDPSRYFEGLDWQESVATLMRWTRLETASEVSSAAFAGIEYGDLRDLNKDPNDTCLFGKGVTAAAAVSLRQELDAAGFHEVRIILSGGFDALKARIFGNLGVPVDVIGTSEFLPVDFRACQASMDAVRYEFAEGNTLKSYNVAKAGREHLLLGPASAAAAEAKARTDSITHLKPVGETGTPVRSIHKIKQEVAEGS